MRSRPDFSGLVLSLLLAVAAPALPAGEAPSIEEIDRAVEAVKSDPDLASSRTVTRLVWDTKEEKKPRKSTSLPGWLRWIGDLFSWLAQTSQMLFWLLIAAFVAVIAVFLVRLFAARSGITRGKDFVAPTHVQDLDIRPESLPDDIGAAARQLWDRGDHRAALALLYRGLLSRLAHDWQVPIRDSSTEGDCLVLAASVIEPRRLDFATRLVRTWQRAIYGGLEVETSVIHELCAGFDAHLNRPEPSESPGGATFAGGAAT